MLICVGTAACVLRCLQVERVLSELLDASDRRAVFEGLEPRMGTHFCSLLQRVLETEYARGMAAGRDAEQRAQLAMVQHQASQSRRSRGRRGRSRGPGSEKSYGPSNEASMEDFDSDEDGMVSRQRSRVSHMRSEVSFDPSMWAGDDSDDDEYDEDDCGIGASFRPQPDGQVHCIGLLNGGPAEQSGLLQTGDIVLKVDNAAVHGMTHSEVQDRIMGPAESLVELEIQRDDELLTIEIRRDWTSNPKKARAMPQASGEFDPSIYAGSTSDEDSEEDTDQECGIGMSVGLDEMGLYRVTEVVLGGAADSTDDVCVGDILEGIDDVLISTCLSPPPPRVSLALSDSLSLACAFSLSLSLSPDTEMRQQHVMGLLRGPPKTTVVLTLLRQKQQRTVTVTRQRAETRVWRVLSEYSTMHPEDFENFAETSTAADRTDRAKSAVEDMKSRLLSQNEDIAILRARMEEAERGKVMRVCRLLAWAI